MLRVLLLSELLKHVKSKKRERSETSKDHDPSWSRESLACHDLVKDPGIYSILAGDFLELDQKGPSVAHCLSCAFNWQWAPTATVILQCDRAAHGVQRISTVTWLVAV